MRNPFAKPRTLGQWLLGSVCWVVVCVGGWCGIAYLLLNIFPENNGENFLLTLSSFCTGHVLIWGKAVAGIGALRDANKGPISVGYGALLLVTSLWWFALVVFQSICMLLMPFVCLFMNDNSSYAPWLNF